MIMLDLHVLPLAYLLLFFGLAFVLPSLRVYQKTGVNPYRLGRSDSAHDFIGRLFRVTLLSILALVGVYAFSPMLYEYLSPLTWLEQPFLKLLGWFLLAVSLVWILVAQAQMQGSWRIGIDQNQKTSLIQHGLFGLSRNPIFLGMRLLLLGLFFVMPNALSLTLWILGDVLMQIQVRLEEAYLSRLHGVRYLLYWERVGRWF
jgi:protein-S-isoprenylcysteine O-methyltransferase Ste14